NLHYITQFRYPLHGGFATYVNSVRSDAAVHLAHTLEMVDVKKKTLTFANGQVVGYDQLISSLPLTELVRRIKDAPRPVREAADRLVCISVALVDVGVERDDDFPDGHW